MYRNHIFFSPSFFKNQGHFADAPAHSVFAVQREKIKKPHMQVFSTYTCGQLSSLASFFAGDDMHTTKPPRQKGAALSIAA
jgi:hypothetical protein